jgi:hypothetical protein
MAASMAIATVAPDKSLPRVTEFIIRAAGGMVNRFSWAVMRSAESKNVGGRNQRQARTVKTLNRMDVGFAKK